MDDDVGVLLPQAGTIADPYLVNIGDDIFWNFCVEDLDHDVTTVRVLQYSPFTGTVPIRDQTWNIPCGVDECCWWIMFTIVGPAGDWRAEGIASDAAGHQTTTIDYFRSS